MKRRYLIHKLNHTVLLVDITPIDLPAEIYPPEGKEQAVSSLRFQTWKAAEEFLKRAGANHRELERTFDTLKKSSLAGLTITE